MEYKISILKFLDLYFKKNSEINKKIERKRLERIYKSISGILTTGYLIYILPGLLNNYSSVKGIINKIKVFFNTCNYFWKMIYSYIFNVKNREEIMYLLKKYHHNGNFNLGDVVLIEKYLYPFKNFIYGFTHLDIFIKNLLIFTIAAFGGGLILYFISFLFAIGINKTVFKGWKKKKAKVKDLSLSEQEFKLIILHTLLSYSNWENYGKKWKKLKDKYAKVINKLEEEFLSNNVDIEELRKNYLQAIEDLKKDKIGETLYEADLFFMEVYKEIVKKLG